MALAAPAAKLVFDGVSKTFRVNGQAVTALDKFTLSVAPGRFVAVLGPSGCGKTTVLRLADGLIEPDSGTVLVSGKPPRPGRGTGFVFQSFRLLPWATVAANVALPLEIAGVAAGQRHELVARYLALVGLDGFADAYPNQLSGGMKQRTALARALITEPDILLMDEPFASVDAQLRELMQIELTRIWSVRRPLVLFVTHSVDEAVLLADEVVLMGPRPGTVLEVVEVGLPRPRFDYDARAEPDFIRLRAYLWERVRSTMPGDGRG